MCFVERGPQLDATTRWLKMQFQYMRLSHAAVCEGVSACSLSDRDSTGTSLLPRRMPRIVLALCQCLLRGFRWIAEPREQIPGLPPGA